MCLLSIIIPTKNRQYYCLKSIEQILSVVSTNVEIIVQDNSDNESLREEFNNEKFNRVKYNYNSGVLSFVDNFSEAVSLCSGKYVCMIGDDDGVLSNIEKIAEYCDENNLDAFVPGLNAIYSWPSKTTFVKGAEKGYLYVTPIKNSIRKVNCKKSLRKLMKRAFQDYQETNIPRLYHGIVLRDKLNEIKQMTGHYFGGLTPDMFMAIALTYVCKNVEVSLFPITISGICPTSGSAASATGAHTGELKDAPHFKGHTSYTWREEIPYFYSVETIWAETALQAMSEMNNSSDLNKVNYAYLMAVLKTKYPQFNDRINAHMKMKKISKISVAISKLKILFNKLEVKCYKLFTGYRKKSKRLYDIEDVKQAENVINGILKDARL